MQTIDKNFKFENGIWRFYYRAKSTDILTPVIEAQNDGCLISYVTTYPNGDLVELRTKEQRLYLFQDQHYLTRDSDINFFVKRFMMALKNRKISCDEKALREELVDVALFKLELEERIGSDYRRLN